MWNKKVLYSGVFFLFVITVLTNVLPHLFYDELDGVDTIVVHKKERTLEVWHRGKIIRAYPISLGGNPVGPKRQEGDQRTPEGNYTVEWKHPKSAYYLALRLSYPNAVDKLHVKQGISLGGDIMIHGMPNGLGMLYPVFTYFDWTQGCIAVSNTAMKELFESVSVGTPVRIIP